MADKRWLEASRAGWSQAASDSCDDVAFGFAPDEERYDRSSVVGAGGMGTVVRTHDRRLMREVALKEVRPDRPRELLLREARLTARLEHPNIVPIYDAGTSATGEIFYTMRLVNGRSLAQALSTCTSVDERMAFLRHYHHVCEAVAFAHSRGVVHCDLKPANVMIGDFGETQVVDWGLAVVVPSATEDNLPDPPLRAGTPLYMSPEQREGTLPGPHFDVWSLGAILHELLAGTPPATGSALEHQAHFELRAICRKALAQPVENRYSSAAELASDVARHLEGRRVGAHAYRPLELLGHVVRAWKVPLLIALTAGIMLVVVLTTSWFRVTTERQRAKAAEATASEALRSSSESLAWALSQQAVAALDKGQRAEAEILAVNALQHAEQPDARGVIAAVRAWERPRAQWTAAGPRCRRSHPDPDGAAVCLSDRGVEYWTRSDDRNALDLVWARPGRVVAAAVLPNIVAIATGSRILGLSKTSGEVLWSVASDDHTLAADRYAGRVVSADNNRVTAYQGASGRKLSIARPCAYDVMVRAIGAQGGATALACLDGLVLVVDQETGSVVWRPPARTPSFHRPGTAVAVSKNGATVAVGDAVGGVVIYDQSHKAPIELRKPTNTPIASLRFVSDTQLIVVPEQRGPEVWSVPGQSLVLTLPRDTRSVAGDGTRLVGAGRQFTVWSMPPRFAIGRFEGGVGLSSAAVDWDSGLVAAGRGDGRVALWGRHGERPARATEVSSHVVKRVVFTEADRSLIAATADTSGGARLSGPEYNEAITGLAGRSCRRVAVLDGDIATFVHYGNGLIATELQSGRTTLIDGPSFVDIDVTEDRSRAVLVAADGDVYQFNSDHGLCRLFAAPNATAAAQATTGAVAVLVPDSVRLHSPAGALLRRLESSLGNLLDVAISRDGGLIAAASRSGGVEVWDASGSLRATLRGHRERAAFVEFHNQTLVSAGWDGVVQLWNLSTLDATPQTLLRDSRDAWGRDLSSLRTTPDLDGIP